MSYILHIDTSADTSSIAITLKGQILTTATNTETRNHAASINNMIEQVLGDINIKSTDLNAVAVCSGPGSYTGLRIAMATAKGICYALDIPLILNDKLALLAGNDATKYTEPASFASILIAREGEYFMGIYGREGDVIVNAAHFTEEKMAEILKFQEKLHITTNVVEDIFYKLKVSFLTLNQDITLDFHYWAKIAYEQYSNQHFTNILYATPQYLKQVYTHK